jgi:hypothetical protein
MSWREHWPEVRSSVNAGDVISGCRDNDTCTYRLFVNKGWRDVKIGMTRGHQIESCECCDLSIEDLRALVTVLEKAIAEHEPWPDPE